MVGDIFLVVTLTLFGLPRHMSFRSYSGTDRTWNPSKIDDFYDSDNMNYLDLYDKFSSEEDYRPNWKTSEKHSQNPRNHLKENSEEISGETKTILKILDNNSSSDDDKKSELRIGKKFQVVPILNGPHFSFEAQLHNYFYPKEPEAVPKVEKPLENAKNCSLESVLKLLLKNIRPRSDETTELPATTVQTDFIPEYILKSTMTRYAESSSIFTTPIPSQISGEEERVEIQKKLLENSETEKTPLQSQEVPFGVSNTENLLEELIRYAKNHTDMLEFIKLQLVSDDRIGSAILGSALPDSITTETDPPVSPGDEITTEEASTEVITTEEDFTEEITTSESTLSEITTSENELTTDETTSDLITTESNPTFETTEFISTTEYSIPSPTPLTQPFERRRKRHVTNVKTELHNELCRLETDLSISSSESKWKSTSNAQSLKTVESVEVGEIIDDDDDTEILNTDPIVEHIHSKLLKKEKKPYGYEKSRHKCNNKTTKPAPLELELSIETEELIEHPPPFIKSAK